MHILLIEDDKNLCRSLSRGLGESGYLVESTYDGVTGEDYALVSDFDLIILDVMLPDKSGIEICCSLRAREISTPVLMLTARTTVEDKIKGLDAGADDYLCKPFSFEELLARVRALLRRRIPLKPQIISLANITLNTASHDVKVDGKKVNLTVTEYRILEYLAINPNILITRTMIEDNIWGLDNNHDSNVVDAFIKRLRDKMRLDSKTGFIQTVRGEGYKLVR